MAPVLISALVVGFIAWAIMLSRQQSQHKKEAIASLQAEKESLPAFSIHALVKAEVADLRLFEIDGASGIPVEVLLKTWNAKGLRTVHDVRSPVAAAGASRNLRVDREAPSGNDFLKNAARRRPLKKKPE